MTKILPNGTTLPLLCLGIIATMLSSNVKSQAHALSQSIVTIGLNAALQKRFILPPKVTLEPGNVHRSQSVETGVGGKGQDVGVALSCLMSASSTNDKKTKKNNYEKVLLAQFLGQGAEGDSVSSILSTQFSLSDTLTVRNTAPLRTCTTIVASDCATELVETSGEITEDEMMELNAKIDNLANEGGKACGVCIMGSMPPGCKEDTYADLTTRLAGKESLVLIDSVIGLTPLLKALKKIYVDDDDDVKGGGGGGGGAVLKLNAAELCKLAGVTKSPGGEADRVTMEELTASTKGFVTKFTDAVGALDYLCITDGKYPGYLVELPKSNEEEDEEEDHFRTWQLPAVDLSNQAKDGMLYPIGAGDTVAAGTLAAWQYLQHSKEGDDDFFGVIPSHGVGSKLSDVRAEWCKGVECPKEEKGYNMATAFAFGLACGSASCLKQENSVFDVEDAVKFFGAMTRPVLQ